MKEVITIAQLVISVVLIILVLLQEKGGGLSGAFGGSEASGFAPRKRGLERLIYFATLAFLILFAVISLANLLIK